MDEFLAGFADRPNLPTSPSFHAMEESSSKKLMRDHPSATAASVFTDDLILEILSRLPARSVHRFKCVSTPWRDLIADPVNRKKLPQTLAGFLYSASNRGGGDWSPHFATVSGGAAPVDPSLHFLQPKKYKYIALLDTCHGLLLCSCYNKDDFRYVVCNPATEKWIELPPQPQDQAKRLYSATRLAFDPAVPSHFCVLRFGETSMDVGSCVTGVDIFSSQTGAWTQRDCGLVDKIELFHGIRSVFFGGMLYLVGRLNPIRIDQGYVLVVVDMEGKAWKTIRFPVGSGCGTIGLSQGCLCYASTTGAHVYNSNKENDVEATKITLWFLENYDSKEWVLRHSADIDDPSGITGLDCRVIAYHPDCDTVFLVGRHMLASYSMQHQKFAHILNLEKDNLRIFLPYVPLFSEALADADRQ